MKLSAKRCLSVLLSICLLFGTLTMVASGSTTGFGLSRQQTIGASADTPVVPVGASARRTTMLKSAVTHTVTGVSAMPNWDSASIDVPANSTQEQIYKYLSHELPPTRIEVSAVGSDGTTYDGNVHVEAWIWPEEVDGLDVVPAGTYTLKPKPFNTFNIKDKDESIEPVNFADDIVWPEITVTVIKSDDVSTNDYTYDSTNGVLTILTDDGMERVDRYESVWKTAGIWPSEIKKVVITSGVTKLQNQVFEGCYGITEVDFSAADDLKSIGVSAFSGCEALAEIEIPTSVTTIGKEAFFYCTGLTTVSFAEPSKITELPEKTFIFCESLANVQLPENLETIGVSAFSVCNALTEIEIPDSVTTIADTAFFSCHGLKSVGFGADSKLKVVGDSAFSVCIDLTDIELPETVETLGYMVFSGCTSLESFNIPAEIQELNSILGGCTLLEEITVSEDSPYFTVVDGVLCSKDEKTLYFCPPAIPQTEYNIPAEVTVIGENAFTQNQTLERINVHANVTSIKRDAFALATKLAWIDIQDGENGSKLSEIEDGAFTRGKMNSDDAPLPVLDIYLPKSMPESAFAGLTYLFGNSDQGDTDMDDILRLFVYYGSAAERWCKAGGCPHYLRPDSIALQNNPPAEMYKYIPYMFTPKTAVPDNSGLQFWLEDTNGNPLELPEGLHLYDGLTLPADAPEGIYPGAIYGSPLSYEAFVNGVQFVMKATNVGDVNRRYFARAEFVIKLAPTPSNAELEQNINAFPFIAEGDDDGRLDDAITGDRSTYNTNQIMHIDGPYPRFDSLWIDGVKQKLKVQYNAEDGSTTVTILSQTIRDLDNGDHTAAAAFRREGDSSNSTNNQFDVVAQNFSVKLSDNGNGDKDNGNGDKDNGKDDDKDNGKDDDKDNGNGNNSSTSGSSGRDSEAFTANPAAVTPAPAQAVNQPAPAQQNVQTPAVTPETAANPPVVDAVETEQDDADADETEQPADNPNESRTGEISGLPTDANGQYYFDPASGEPMEVRIDIPFAEFNGLAIDGDTWTRDVDYAVREGSTILTITAERMMKLDAGMHSFTAQFNGQDVEFSFNLLKAAADSGEISGGVPVVPVAIVLAALIVAAVVVIVRVRGKKASA